jgi:hypothetical protein
MNHKEVRIWIRFRIGFRADSCEYGDAHWDSVKNGEFLDRLSKYQLKDGKKSDKPLREGRSRILTLGELTETDVDPCTMRADRIIPI